MITYVNENTDITVQRNVCVHTSSTTEEVNNSHV